VLKKNLPPKTKINSNQLSLWTKPWKKDAVAEPNPNDI
jgi:hypothetical protein